jgi:RNA polymerase sigma factor (sigma-70 family)
MVNAVLVRQDPGHSSKPSPAHVDRRRKTRRPTAQEQARAEELCVTPIAFIHDLRFETGDDAPEPAAEHFPADFLDHDRGAYALQVTDQWQRICGVALLTPEQEQALFRRMNFLKYRAHCLSVDLDLENLNIDLLKSVELLLNEADEVRNYLVQANLRLVMSVAKNFVTPQHAYDELISDGVMTLMATIDKFDSQRGFRFSTYAYRSIFRSLCRSAEKRRKDNFHISLDSTDSLDPEQTTDLSDTSERRWESVSGMLTALCTNLDDREQYIIQRRFALGDELKPDTFQKLATQLGISKERVRQLNDRAVRKLRSMAEESELGQLVETLVA